MYVHACCRLDNAAGSPYSHTRPQDIQLTLRHAAHALRQARLPPIMSPAGAQARLRGEAGVAGVSHTLTSTTPFSLSTLRLREAAWRHVAEALAQAPADTGSETLLSVLQHGASLAARDEV